jgi:hypothetical protein
VANGQQSGNCSIASLLLSFNQVNFFLSVSKAHHRVHAMKTACHAGGHVCERQVSALLPSKPRLIVQYLQRHQNQWHHACFPAELRQHDEISCICICRLGHRMGDIQATQLASALSALPSNTCLKALQLCRNSIGGSGLLSLLHGLESPLHLQLQCLTLCHNPIGICTIEIALYSSI